MELYELEDNLEAIVDSYLAEGFIGAEVIAWVTLCFAYAVGSAYFLATMIAMGALCVSILTG
jgi:hypothetical protein